MADSTKTPAPETVLPPLANIDGKIVPLFEAKVSVLDRGFLFGDAVYEVLRIYGGRPWLEEEHFRRLEHSLGAIRIRGIDLARLRCRMHDTIAEGSFREATVYIEVTRGAAPRAHAFPSPAKPLELLFVQTFADPYVEARKTGCAVITHPDLRWGRCDIKSTNLLANVLALQAAKEADGLEAILYRPDGTVTEATHSSLFGVINGVLRTAPKTSAILPGVTRDLVVELAKHDDVPLEERSLTRDELSIASELFMTGTTAEVLPVTKVDGRAVGNGKPGEVTRKLQEAYRDSVREFLAADE
jgi:D-alanine transaminase